MKMKTLFLFLILTWSSFAVPNSGALRLAGSVPYRTDQMIQFDQEALVIDPSAEPSLKVQVSPLRRRSPASEKRKRLVGRKEVLREASLISVEAP